MARKVLLVCGIVAALLYVGSDIVAAMCWEGYSYTGQSVSELRAIGAPTRPLLLPLLTIYTVLEIAFGFGVWRAAGEKRALRIAGVLLIVLGIVDLTAPFFPMHLGGTGGTLTDTMHLILTSVTVLSMLLIIGFGSTADGKWFRLYSIATLLMLIVAGAWASGSAHRIEANLPTPWVGVRERINIYGYMLWIAVLAIALLRVRSDTLRPEARQRTSILTTMDSPVRRVHQEHQFLPPEECASAGVEHERFPLPQPLSAPQPPAT